MSKSNHREDALRGFLDILPLMAGAAPFALFLGSLAVQKGMSPLEVTLMSISVYAGSSQFIAIDLWSTPVPVAAIVGTTLLVNLRHLLMGAALVPHVGLLGRGPRWFFISVHSDETWALSLQRVARGGALTPAYVLGMIVPFYLQWPVWTFVGALVGAQMENPATYGIDFVFPAVFITLVIGFWKASRQTLVIAVSAAVALAAHAVLEGVWYIFIAGLAGTATGAVLFRVKDEGPAEAKTWA